MESVAWARQHFFSASRMPNMKGSMLCRPSTQRELVDICSNTISVDDKDRSDKEGIGKRKRRNRYQRIEQMTNKQEDAPTRIHLRVFKTQRQIYLNEVCRLINWQLQKSKYVLDFNGVESATIEYVGNRMRSNLGWPPAHIQAPYRIQRWQCRNQQLLLAHYIR